MYNGLIVINKVAGFTSSDVVAKLRGILHMRKIGHTGTLDPDAVGVLPVCLGSGTKLVEMIGGQEKEYRAVMRLGVVTDTQDMSGAILQSIPEEEIRKSVTEEMVRSTAASFIGEIDQVPPMYSAVKIGGKKLYELARAGKSVERKARRIRILDLEIEKIELPLVTMRVVCSKGTYIRTLCEDIGNALGTGAAMQHLTRTRVGQFTLEQAITLEEAQRIMDSDPEEIGRYILPVDSFFMSFPALRAAPEVQIHLENGNPLMLMETDCSKETALKIKENAGPDSLIRMYGQDGRFYAVYRYDTGSHRLVNVKFFPQSE